MSLRASIAVLLCAAIHWSCTGASDNSQSTADGGAGASGDGSSCDTADPCVDDTDCGPGTRCNHQSCTRLYCLSDGSPCENDVICESETCVLSPSDYVCWSGPVAEGWSCLASECQSGLSCVSGTCRGLGSIGLDEACTETDQCVSDLLCRPLSCGQSSSTCRELSNVDGSCCDASDCRTGLQCESGTCQSPATLTFLPESITFDFVQHQPGPPSQTIRITNEGGITAEFYVDAILDDVITWDPVGSQTLAGGETIDYVLTPAEGLEEVTFCQDTIDPHLQLNLLGSGTPIGLPIVINISGVEPDACAFP